MPEQSVEPRLFYDELGRLIETMPDLTATPDTPDTREWVGRASAVVTAAGTMAESAALNIAAASLNAETPEGSKRAADQIATILYRVRAMIELQTISPPGTFSGAGQKFDAFAAIRQILASARNDVLIVDPAMDEKTLTEFVPRIAEGVTVRLLTDKSLQKPSFAPAVDHWMSQHGQTRTLNVRLAGARALHDRLVIVDTAVVWMFTQSLTAIATQSPAAVVPIEGDPAALKLAFYDKLWASAAPLSGESNGANPPSTR
jgi:hypothetical protein